MLVIFGGIVIVVMVMVEAEQVMVVVLVGPGRLVRVVGMVLALLLVHADGVLGLVEQRLVGLVGVGLARDLVGRGLGGGLLGVGNGVTGKRFGVSLFGGNDGKGRRG